MFLLIFLQNVLLVFAIILIKTEADPWGVWRGGCSKSHTFFFCQIIIKRALTWLEYTNQNLCGGDSSTSAAQYGFAIALEHLIPPICKNNLFLFC